MSEPFLGLLIESLVAVLLTLTIGYCLILTALEAAARGRVVAPRHFQSFLGTPSASGASRIANDPARMLRHARERLRTADLILSSCRREPARHEIIRYPRIALRRSHRTPCPSSRSRRNRSAAAHGCRDVAAAQRSHTARVNSASFCLASRATMPPR